jgi:EAL domain-containing protein (putative c-di-GMP-specific phosphodiesterase class I)
MVSDALAAASLHPSRLEIELTESTLMEDPERTIATLAAIRDLGVTVAMDDFGTGYSSLSTLRSFRFDKIKLDRSFMSELGTDPHSEAVLRAVLTLGRSLDIAVLAEGVETAEQLEFLRDEGCTEAQGFLLGRPEPIRAARASIEDRKPPATLAA